MDAQRVQFHPINFFEEAPVEGCDYYYVSMCPLPQLGTAYD